MNIEFPVLNFNSIQKPHSTRLEQLLKEYLTMIELQDPTDFLQKLLKLSNQNEFKKQLKQVKDIHSSLIHSLSFSVFHAWDSLEFTLEKPNEQSDPEDMLEMDYGDDFGSGSLIVQSQTQVRGLVGFVKRLVIKCRDEKEWNDMRNRQLHYLNRANEIAPSVDLRLKLAEKLHQLNKKDEEFELLFSLVKDKVSSREERLILQRIQMLLLERGVVDKALAIEMYLKDPLDRVESAEPLVNMKKELELVKLEVSLYKSRVKTSFVDQPIEPEPFKFPLQKSLFYSSGKLILKYLKNEAIVDLYLDNDNIAGDLSFSQSLTQTQKESDNLAESFGFDVAFGNMGGLFDDMYAENTQQTVETISVEESGQQDPAVSTSGAAEPILVEDSEQTTEIAAEVDDKDESTDTEKRKRNEPRTSNRVRKQMVTEDEAIPKVEIQPLEELNDILPDQFQFTSTGSSFSNNFPTLVLSIQREFKAKLNQTRKPKKEKRGIDWKQRLLALDNDTFWFFQRSSVEEFFQKLDYNVFDIPTILLKILVFAFRNIRQQVCKEFVDFVAITVEILSENSSLLSNMESLESEIGNESQDKGNILISLADVVFQGFVAGDEHIPFTLNPLQSSYKEAVFERIVEYLDKQKLELSLQIRLQFLKSKYYHWKTYAQLSFEALLKTLELFTEYQEPLEILTMLSDNVVDFDRLGAKIHYQKVKVEVEECFELGRAEDYSAIYNRLKKYVLGPVIDDEDVMIIEDPKSQISNDFNEVVLDEMPHPKQLELLSLLRKGCCENRERFLCDLKRGYVILNMMQEDMIGFDEKLASFKAIVESLLALIKEDSIPLPYLEFHTIDLKRLKAYNEFGNFCFLVCHVSWIIVQGMFELDDPQKAIAAKKELYSGFVASAWELLFCLLNHLFKSFDKETANNALSEMLIWVHDQLGIVAMCNGNNGSLLRLIVDHVAISDSYYHYEIYQSYCCLFGTDVKSTPSQVLQDHKTKKTKFGVDAGNLMFKFIQPMVKDKLDSFVVKSIPKDIRNCLEMISEVFTEPPFWVSIIQVNFDKITEFLGGDINLKTILPQISQNLALFDIKHDVYFELFYFKGKLLMNDYLSLTKADAAARKAIEAAIKNLIYHVSIVPTHIDGWISLGNAFGLLANQILGGKVLEYRDRMIISDYQKSSFHCLVRAIKLMQSVREVEGERAADLSCLLWGDFAILLQCIISAPMNGEALKLTGKDLNNVWGERVKEIFGYVHEVTQPNSKELQKQKTTNLYNCMAYILQKAISYDNEQWAFYFRLAHCHRKLCKDPWTIVKVYIKALDLLPKDFGSKDQDSSLDIVYKCTTFILKANERGYVTETDALNHIQKFIDHHSAVSDQLANIPTPKIKANSLVIKCFQIFEAIKKLDKRKWLHKPYYRVAKLYERYGQLNDAMEEMVLFLNGRSKSGMRRIWRTDLELHGRHFVYFHQYLKYFGELALKLKDIQLLWLLCRRLNSDDPIMLRYQLWLESRKQLFELIQELLAPIYNSTDDFILHVDSIDAELEKKMIANYRPNTNQKIYYLAVLCDLKRNRKVPEQELEDVITNLYCELYLKTSNFSMLERVRKDPKKLLSKVVQKAISLTKGLALTQNPESV